MRARFWSGDSALVRKGNLDLGSVPAHGVALIALRQHSPGAPLYLGADLHISQGGEVRTWRWDDGRGELRFELERPGRARGMVDLYLPSPLKDATVDGNPLAWEKRQGGVYRLAVDFERRADVMVKW